MICCKIVADFNNKDGNFGLLCDLLGARGDCLWENGVFYFGDTENQKTNEKTVSAALRKSGYGKFFIDVYCKENQPHETDDSINGWIVDKLIKINYAKYEEESQKVFRDISKGLDILNEEMKAMESAKTQEQEEES